MRRKMNLCVWAAACLVALGCSSDKGGDKPGDAGGDKAARTVETAFIPQDAVAVLVAYPSAILDSDVLADAPLEKALQDIQEGAGVDPKNVEQIVMPIYTDRDAPPAVVVRTKQPYDKEKIGGRQFSGERRREAEHEGKKYIQAVYPAFSVPDFEKGASADKNANDKDAKSTEDEKPKDEFKPTGDAIYFVDDTTFIAGSEKSLKKMISAEKADSDLIKQLKNIEPHDIVFVANVADSRDTLKEASQAAKDSPYADVATWAAEHVETVSFWLDVSPKLAFNLTLDSDDETGGAKVKKSADEALTQLEGLVMGLGPVVLKGERSPLSKELADKVIKLGQDAVKAIKVEDKGKVVEVSFTAPDNARAVFDELKPVLKEYEEKQRKEAEEAEKQWKEQMKKFQGQEKESFDSPAKESVEELDSPVDESKEGIEPDPAKG